MKVFLSVGGPTANFSFTNESDVANFADSLWDRFGGGESQDRPFGDAILDGFDIFFPNGASNGTLLEGFARQMQSHYLRSTTDTDGKKYYLSVSPDCLNPSPSLLAALHTEIVDFLFVRFRGPCTPEVICH
jgi:chitinase